MALLYPHRISLPPILLLFLLFVVFIHAGEAPKPLQAPPTDKPGLKRRFHKFVTRPDIDAPVFDVKVRNEYAASLAPGYWFVAFYGQLDQRSPGDEWLGPHIYDQTGELIWAGAPAFKHWNVFDFGFDHENAGDVLTLLSNHERTAYIVDNTYQVQKEVPLVIDGEKKPNMHSFHVIDGGKRALILTISPSKATEEMSRRVGFDGQCDAKYQGFREVDLESSNFRPIFEWNAIDHIGLDESTFSRFNGSVTDLCTKGWDILHLNSVDKFPDGDYLLSSRHTDALYKISHIDGSIVWRLGGTKSDFKLPGDSVFSRQHHGRVILQDSDKIIVTLFDNAIGDGFEEVATHEYSRGLVLLLDTQNMTAQTLVEYPHPQRRRTNARGSFQTLPNGNAFLCWAYSSRVSEYLPNGELIMEAVLDVRAHTYRAFKYPWVGRPAHPPDVVAEAVFSGESVVTDVHMSWNGATEVDGWLVKEVQDDGGERVVGSARRTGFETRAKCAGYARRVFAEAFDKEGRSLGRSNTILTVPPSKVGEEPMLKHLDSTIGGSPSAVGYGSNTHKAALSTDIGLPEHPSFFLLGVVASLVVGAILFRKHRQRKSGMMLMWPSDLDKHDPVTSERGASRSLHRRKPTAGSSDIFL